MTISCDAAKVIQQFLLRATLRGDEVPAFNRIMDDLERIAHCNDGKEEKNHLSRGQLSGDFDQHD